MNKTTISVVNIKCGGCEKGIIDALRKEGLQNVSVDVAQQTVTFEGNRETGVTQLTKLGYPEAGTDEAKSILKKARSYETCAVGTIEEGIHNNAKRTGKFWFIVVSPVLALLLLGVLGYVFLQKDGSGTSIENREQRGGMMHGTPGETFALLADEDLPEVKPTEVIVLADGDTYEMTAGIVKQEVGNRTIRRLAYNGMIPGPTIKVPQGGVITLKFTNGLDIETTLHSHGLRGKDEFDGVPIEMGGKQENMQPGETFEYTLEFPDAGVFWYHPHLREDYTQEMGLYGNYWVDKKDYWNPVAKEEFIIVDDFSENDPFFKEVTNKAMMGRYGNILMINNDVEYTFSAQTGERIRFFMTNTANTRVFDIALRDESGASIPLTIVGGDIGRVENEYVAHNIITAPAERYIFETSFAKPGEYDITHRGEKFGTILITGAEKTVSTLPLRNNSSDYTLIKNQFDALLAKKADKSLRLTIGMKGMGEMRRGMRHRSENGNMMNGTESDMAEMEHSMGGTMAMEHDEGIEWEDGMAMMNAMSNSDRLEWKMIDEDTGKVSMAIDDWKFKKNQLVKIRIFNDPESMHPMQHPIHFHGQRFVILARNGVPNTNLQWKDTALVRTGETMDIVVEMTNPGDWMAHCHIAEHLHAGMMMNFVVRE